MSDSCNYNCVDLPAHEQIDCGAWRKGGFPAFALLTCDHTITDWSSQSEWQSNITAGNVFIIGPKGVKGSFPDPSPIEGENPNACGAANIVDNYDRTFVAKDFNWNANNIDLYNKIKGREYFLVVFDGCNGVSKITVVDVLAVFNIIETRPESNREKQFFTFTASYTQLDTPMEYDAPEGIFGNAA